MNISFVKKQINYVKYLLLIQLKKLSFFSIGKSFLKTYCNVSITQFRNKHKLSLNNS